MAEKNNLLLCYNRGCGQKYDPDTNTKESCRHHPGAPFFHDAYKGWSCCNKKCTDFTEFLNIKGCTLSFHSNVKPPEPEKQQVDEELLEHANNKQPTSTPIIASTLVRPPFDSPMIKMEPEISPSLKQEMEKLANHNELTNQEAATTGVVTIGTTCKNNGCNATYEGPDSENGICVYHPGCPIFHEGLKFWSCCQKRTSDFNAFLNQAGCESGKHLWFKELSEATKMNCRWDWHQTGSHVIVTIYVKKYCPNRSTIKLNPIRLMARLVFPNQSNAEFNIDLELRGIIDVKASKVQMFGTKVEISLKKAEPGSWVKLDFPREKFVKEHPEPLKPEIEEITPEMDAVDLSDL